MLIENMNNQNADIDLNQTQRASNHEFNIKTSQSSSTQALCAKMKTRIVKLMQQIMIIFMKTHSNDSSFVHSIFQAERSHSKSSFHELTSFK